jgi:hypothetical protein
MFKRRNGAATGLCGKSMIEQNLVEMSQVFLYAGMLAEMQHSPYYLSVNPS